MYICPILHPSYILRGNWSEDPAQVIYLRRVKRILEEGAWPISDPHTPPPGALLFPTLDEMHEWSQKIGPRGISVDIECAGDHIRMIGMCRVDDLVPICIHFRTQGGHKYWKRYKLFSAVVEWLWDILSNPDIIKVFQNGQAFDIPILERNGFVVHGYSEDTMLRQHIAYPEMPKKLEWMARVYLGSTGWKHLVREDDEGEGK